MRRVRGRYDCIAMLLMDQVILVDVSQMFSKACANEYRDNSRVQTDVQKKRFHSPKGQRL